jgi:hypothetical protein
MSNLKIMPSTTIAAPVPIPTGFKGNFAEPRDTGAHPGTDIPVPSGTEVKAPMDGVVENVKDDEYPCGGTIDIDYKNGFWSRFCHMKKINVKKGDVVSQGQVVGLSGGGSNDFGKGRTSGPHLHFSLHKDGVNVDPMKYINTEATVGDIQGTNANVDDVKNIAGKLTTSSSGEMSWDDFRKQYPPEVVRAALEKSLTGVFTEEIKRIKELMK